MSTIHLEQTHALGRDEALRRAQALGERLGGKLSAEIVWNGSTASFKGKGFSGSARVDEDRVAIDVDLALLLRPLKGRIESEIESALARKFV